MFNPQEDSAHDAAVTASRRFLLFALVVFVAVVVLIAVVFACEVGDLMYDSNPVPQRNILSSVSLRS